jgi:hypothetical protein
MAGLFRILNEDSGGETLPSHGEGLEKQSSFLSLAFALLRYCTRAPPH